MRLRPFVPSNSDVPLVSVSAYSHARISRIHSWSLGSALILTCDSLAVETYLESVGRRLAGLADFAAESRRGAFSQKLDVSRRRSYLTDSARNWRT